MIVHVKGADVQLEPLGVDDGHSSDATSLYAGSESDGATYALGPGDVIYDCPIGGKRLRSPASRAAYVVRYRRREVAAG